MKTLSGPIVKVRSEDGLRTLTVHEPPFNEKVKDTTPARVDNMALLIPSRVLAHVALVNAANLGILAPNDIVEAG